MNWALVPNTPSETRLFAPGKGAEDFAFINIHIIKRALLEVARRWHHLVGSHVVSTREAETNWYGTDRCVDTEERKWDGEVKLWWTAQCWFAVLKSDSESSTQEIVLCAAPVNENNGLNRMYSRLYNPSFVQSCMVTLTLPRSTWTLQRNSTARWAPTS